MGSKTGIENGCFTKTLQCSPLINVATAVANSTHDTSPSMLTSKQPLMKLTTSSTCFRNMFVESFSMSSINRSVRSDSFSDRDCLSSLTTTEPIIARRCLSSRDNGLSKPPANLVQADLSCCHSVSDRIFFISVVRAIGVRAEDLASPVALPENIQLRRRPLRVTFVGWGLLGAVPLLALIAELTVSSDRGDAGWPVLGAWASTSRLKRRSCFSSLFPSEISCCLGSWHGSSTRVTNC